MYTYKAKLERVVDGDTLDASIDLGFDVIVRKRIRLAGINTPESRTRRKKTWSCCKASVNRYVNH